jgi:hypothetical protein
MLALQFSVKWISPMPFWHWTHSKNFIFSVSYYTLINPCFTAGRWIEMLCAWSDTFCELQESLAKLSYVTNLEAFKVGVWKCHSLTDCPTMFRVLTSTTRRLWRGKHCDSWERYMIWYKNIFTSGFKKKSRSSLSIVHAPASSIISVSCFAHLVELGVSSLSISRGRIYQKVASRSGVRTRDGHVRWRWWESARVSTMRRKSNHHHHASRKRRRGKKQSRACKLFRLSRLVPGTCSGESWRRRVISQGRPTQGNATVLAPNHHTVL